MNDSFEKDYVNDKKLDIGFIVFCVLMIAISIILIIFTINVLIDEFNKCCPECGNSISDTVFTKEKFCEDCGIKLLNYCDCGLLNDEDASFCRSCGKELK